MRVDVTPRADAALGVIERHHAGDAETVAEIRGAWLRGLVELRKGHPSVWLIPSEQHPGASALHEPPLILHFVPASTGRVAVIDVDQV